jgi:hypothetical protein
MNSEHDKYLNAINALTSRWCTVRKMNAKDTNSLLHSLKTWASDQIDNNNKNEHRKKGKPGTVIRGTRREEDFVSALMNLLEELDPTKARRFRDDMPEYGTTEMATFASQELCWALDDCSPEGCYFGSHPSDNSDLGFWPIDACK